ncbi:MAG: response regulator [Bacteroidales bacterium]|nr:response regulator [Bacteroidales bacterium]
MKVLPSLPNILIVDDIEENLQFLESIVKSFDINLIKANSGAEALKKTKGLDLALAIIDVWMPKMNGYELAVRINEDKTDNKVPVVFLTASISDEIERLKGYKSGAVDYIFKPVKRSIIQSKVSIFLDLYKQKQKIFFDALELRQYTEELAKLNKSLKKSEEKEKKLSSALKNTLDNLEVLVDLRTEELARTENLYFTTVNSLTDWICVSDESNKIIFTNQSLNNFLQNNNQKEDILGKDIKDVLVFLNETELKYYKKVFSSGKTKTIEGKYLIFGKSYFLQIKLSPVKSDNKTVRIVTTVYDYTKQKLAEEEILKNLEREKNLNDMKSQFISTVSHEFRTPLAGIHSSVQLLQNFDKKWDDSKKERFYNQIFDAIKRTKTLLDDISLLDNEKLKKATFKPSYINMKEFLDNIVHENIQVYGADFDIECDFKFEKPECFVDKDILQTIIGNVISNAIKYSGSSRRIVFNSKITKKEMIFKIVDFGIGIPAEDLKSLYEPFYRGSNTESIQGTGFGLSLVKRYIDLCKGKISIESEIGKGTAVKIEIPCQNN